MAPRNRTVTLKEATAAQIEEGFADEGLCRGMAQSPVNAGWNFVGMEAPLSPKRVQHVCHVWLGTVAGAGLSVLGLGRCPAGLVSLGEVLKEGLFGR